MPEFANPFGEEVPRKLTDGELLQALRIDLAGELEAAYLYEAHIQATDNPAAIRVLSDIRDDERAHFAGLITLMRALDPTETEHFLKGQNESGNMIRALGIDVESLMPSKN